VEGPASGEDTITVHTYELAAAAYEPTGAHQGTLTTTVVQREITVDLTALS
jgi:hypothetical protein